MMTRGEFCDEAKRIVTSDRNAQYGEPEDNFDIIANFWSVYLNNRRCAGDEFVDVDASDVAVMMTLFKIGRACTAFESKDDTFVDAIGYLACAGEIESAGRELVDGALEAVRKSAEAAEEIDFEQGEREWNEMVAELEARTAIGSDQNVTEDTSSVTAQNAATPVSPAGSAKMDEIADSVDEKLEMHGKGVPHVCSTCRMPSYFLTGYCYSSIPCSECARYEYGECRCVRASQDEQLKALECPYWKSKVPRDKEEDE